MAADIEEAACLERERKCRSVDPRRKLLVDERVEVRSVEEGFQGSWHSGTVIVCEDQIRQVRYDSLLCDDSLKNLIDRVQVSPAVDGVIPTNWAPSNYRSLIRPVPPQLDFGKWCLHYGLCVDVFYNNAWWEGVILDHEDGSEERVIFFPDMGDELKARIGMMRITQEWNEINEDWKPRGNWLFLELVEELKQEWPLTVSVRQIWYEVREKNGFENLEEWTSSGRDVWKELVLLVYWDNFKLTLMETVHKWNSLEGLLPEGHLLLELTEPSLDALLKPTTCQLDRDELLLTDLNKAIQAVEEIIDRDDLASVMDGGRLDMNQLTRSIMPKNEALCVQPPALLILPSNPDEFSRISSSINNREVSSSTSSRKRKSKRTWFPAGPDLVPGAEYCPEAISEYINESKPGTGASSAAALKARKHLSYLGWKIECLRDKGGIHRVRYISPDSKKPYQSLRIVCMDLKGPKSEILSLIPQGDQRSLAAAPDCSFTSSLIEQPRVCNEADMEPSSSDAFVIEPEWLPAGPDIVPEAEYCPEAISEYINNSGYRYSASSEVTLNARKHLSYLGWKIECLRDRSGIHRVRYISPDSKKVYQSLRVLCLKLIGSVSLIPQGNQRSLAAAPDSPFSSPLIEQPLVCRKAPREPSHDDDVVVIEPAYFPQAVAEYYSIGSGISNPRLLKRDAKLRDLQLKAKKHLSAIGWSFFYFRRNGVRKEMRYRSPSGRAYISLLTACKRCIEDGDVPYPNTYAFKEDECQLANEVHGQLIVREDHGPAKSHGISLSSEFVELDKAKIQGSRKLAKKRRNGVPHLASHLPQTKDQNAFSKLLKGKRSGVLVKLRDNLNGDFSTSVMQSSKRSPQVAAPSSSHQTPRTVLSWLIDNNIVLPRAKVQYRCKKDGRTMAEGEITRDGIKCSCCQDVFTPSNFEAHAGSTYRRPSANVFLEDGRSLLECKLQLKCDMSARGFRTKPPELKSNMHFSTNDFICSVCNYGGELVLCDQCPSSFHTSCLGLKEVPDGDWFCPPCCCRICGQSRFNKDTEQFTDNSVLNCDQCELRYHVGCLRRKGLAQLDGYPKGNWFCNKRCEQIFLGLRNLLGKPVQLGVDNLTWTLLKYTTSDSCDHDDSDIEELTENYSKLHVALGVMHECFEPVKEPWTQRDLVENVIFSRWSELHRLNFRGFYTVLLERNDELITVASVRVYGEKVAEVPLVGTRFKYRGRRMCRTLMDELEKKLVELGVERLVLPAVPAVLNTWTTSFGFSMMMKSERLKFLDYTFLDFQDTITCQKLLKKTSTESSLLRRTQQKLCDDINGSSVFCLDGNSAVSEVFQADRIEDSGIVEQKSVDIAGGDGSDGGDDAAPPVIGVNQPTELESIPCQSEITRECSVEAADCEEGENNDDDLFKCYKRRKVSPCGS